MGAGASVVEAAAPAETVTPGGVHFCGDIVCRGLSSWGVIAGGGGVHMLGGTWPAGGVHWPGSWGAGLEGVIARLGGTACPLARPGGVHLAGSSGSKGLGAGLGARATGAGVGAGAGAGPVAGVGPGAAAGREAASGAVTGVSTAALPGCSCPCSPPCPENMVGLQSGCRGGGTMPMGTSAGLGAGNLTGSEAGGRAVLLPGGLTATSSWRPGTASWSGITSRAVVVTPLTAA